MNYDEIKTACATLERGMESRDMGTCSAWYEIKPNGDDTLFLSWSANVGTPNTYLSISCDDPEKGIEAALAFLETVPEAAERDRAKARKATAEALELCRAADIEGEVLAQMEACMKALSKNILTKQEA